jgi:prevent-host-death family protein
MPTVSVADFKSHLSEMISQSVHGNKRIIITRRNKPVAALVSLDDLHVLEQSEERQGLASIAGKWDSFDELARNLDDLGSLRAEGGKGRNVSL